MMRKTVLALVLGIPLASAAAGQVSLNVRDGEIGGTITFEFEGPPNAVHLNMISLSEGPTCFPPPHLQDCVPLGLDLFKLSFQVPGFFGSLDGTGSKSLTFPIPDNPLLDGVVLRDVLLQVDSGVLTHQSALTKVTFAYADTFSLSLGAMFIPHFFTPAATLDDGRVFLAGGSDVPSDHVEAYDHRCEEFENLPSMLLGVVAHTATKLNDGRILCVGGADFSSNKAEQVAQVYDPGTNSWSLTAGQPMSRRAGHSASLLPDGRVLIAGGSLDIADPVVAALNSLDSTEIYDPNTDSFSAGPTMNDPRVAHTATVLSNGEVLISGGLSFVVIVFPLPALIADAQRFDPNTDTLSGDISMNGPRAGATAIRLDDDRVIHVGGIGGSVVSPVFLATIDVANAAGSSFTASAATLSSGRAFPAVAQLPRGDVLVAGGETGDITNSQPVADADLYDPVADSAVATDSLNVPRTTATAVLMADGSVTVFGGSLVNNKAEIYQD